MGARPSSFKAPVAEVRPQREWSEAQQAIFAWFENGCTCYFQEDCMHRFPNLCIRARAGAAKTTSVIEGVNRAPEQSILLCAFNKRIAEELNTRIDNPRAEAKTLHSLGLQMIRREWRGIPVAGNNVRAESLTDIVCKPYEQRKGEKVPFQIKRLVTLLHTKAREMCPLNTSISDVTSLAFRFDYVPDEGWSDYDVEFVTTHALAAVIHAGTEPPTYDIGVDYADMIFLPLVWNLTARDYDLVVADEYQDLNRAQLEIIRRVCSGRVCVVGDDKQSIYNWRGSEANSLDTFKKEMNALELPLKTTYRCGTEIVKHAQRLVPDIEAGPTNPPGVVDECSYDQLIEQAQAGDFVLSRLNAPLVSITLHLLKKGKRARMAGRDIGKGIVAILKKLRCVNSTPIETVIDRVQQWEKKLTSRLAAYGQLDLVDRTRDQAAMILAFAEDAETTGALLQQMDYLFTDDDNETGQILCSSVHKAKGTETDHVFVLIESLYRRGVCEEESNIHYVALTRAKSHLTLVTGVPSLSRGTQRAAGT